MIINGGIECGGSDDTAQGKNRIKYYKSFSEYFNITPGDNLSCANMKQFDAQSNGAIKVYWDQAWTGEAACQLVSYQTAYDLLSEPNNLDGPYCECVDHYFGNVTTVSGASSSIISTTTTTTISPSIIPCSSDNCDSCVAIEGNTGGATDEYCSQCPQYQWWPCNANLCRCPNE